MSQVEWVRSKELGKILGYQDPGKAISKIYNRNKRVFISGIDTKMEKRLSSDKKKYMQRLFSPSGVEKIKKFSRINSERRSQEKVYIAKMGKLVKIGRSTNPKRRVQNISSIIPGDNLEILIILDGGRKLEKSLHYRFRRSHREGEWFKYSKPIKEYVSKQKKIIKRRLSKKTEQCVLFE